MTSAHVLIDQVGPVPLSASFATSGTQQVINISASFYSALGDKDNILLLNVAIDDEHLGVLQVNGSHVDCAHIPISKQFLANLSAGTHSIKITAGNTSTFTDYNDHFDVTLLDLNV